MNLAQIAAYVWLGQALLGLLPWNVDGELSEKMLSGAVAYELLRPLDLYAFWYARTVALRTATTFLRMIPMVVVAGLDACRWSDSVRGRFHRLRVRCGAACFLVSLTATVALAAAITNLMHVALIWTLSGRGFNTLMTGVVDHRIRAGRAVAAVSRLAATVHVLAAVSWPRGRAVSYL